jgi:hypothetical protein
LAFSGWSVPNSNQATELKAGTVMTLTPYGHISEQSEQKANLQGGLDPEGGGRALPEWLHGACLPERAIKAPDRPPAQQTI